MRFPHREHQVVVSRRGHSQFRLENGQFVINIKREEFKNKNGPYFCQNGVFRNYHRALEDHADLYNDIQEYLTYCRPMLLRGNDSDQLFISHVDAGGPRRCWPRLFYPKNLQSVRALGSDR